MDTLKWNNKSLILLDQTLLPGKVEYLECNDYRMVASAIKKLQVRGAPAIGAAAAYGVVLGAQEYIQAADFQDKLIDVANELKQTRPTAVNLFWAIDRMLDVLNGSKHQTNGQITALLEQEADLIAYNDKEVNRKISAFGAELFTSPVAVLTHCNAGSLATVAFGTALGVIRQAWQQGKITRVYADETRPLLQGARLTAWEMMQENIPVTLLTDNMAGWAMKKDMVNAVIVGADRITLNGDVANKIGTYSVAVLAKEHGIPFYVAAPTSTFDFTINTGKDIVIEERGAEEVTCIGGVRVAPEGIEVFNPAFDVTPNQLVTAIITEYGVIRAPYSQAIHALANKRGR